jgi:hypothetical protein
MENVSEPAKMAGSLPGMRLLEPSRVTVLETQVPILLVAGPLLLEILLSHHVQLNISRQRRLRRRLFSHSQPDCLARSFLRSSPIGRAMSVKRGHTTHDERGHSHHYKEPNRFEFSGHESVLRQSHAILTDNIYVQSRQRTGDRTVPCTSIIKLDSIDRKGLHRGKTHRSL